MILSEFIYGKKWLMKQKLGQAGHTVRCEFTGLGELVWVQNMYRDRLMTVL